MRKLVEDYLDIFPIGAKVLNDFYVDDLVTGANILQEASILKKEAIKLLQKGKFVLTKWSSNDPSLQDDQSQLSANQREFILSSDKECETRTLGIVWNYNSDEFKFSNITYLGSLKISTKRIILSKIALIFDPLGLLGPTTLVAKTIMQDLWRLKMNLLE